MKKSVSATALIAGLPMPAWQAAFFLGAAVVLICMTFWRIENYRLVADFSFDSWRAILTSELFLRVYLRTVGYALMAAALASLVVFPFAYGLAFKMSRRATRVALMLLVVPFFTSYLVRSYAWRFMLENDGVVNTLLRALGLPAIEFQGSLASVVIGYFAYFLPLVALIQLLGLMNIDRQYIEAANNLGAGRFRTVFTVVVPLARGALLAGFIFAFMMAMGDFVAPALVGGGARPTLSVMIVNTIQGQSNFPRASVIAVIMLVTLIVVLFLIDRLMFRRRGEAG
jgi:ABC-type spermidine/putrescine transport system permease subunit I